MRTSINVGRLLGIQLKVRPPFFYSSLMLWLVLSVIALWLPLTPLEVVLFGLLGTLVHWLAELLHHLGHAIMARRVGYPMAVLIGLWFLIACLYPQDEPQLPARTHLQRAIGGPLMSLTLALLFGLLVAFWPAEKGLAYYLAWFLFIDNGLVLFLGALLPLGFTDGSTILRYWSRRHET